MTPAFPLLANGLPLRGLQSNGLIPLTQSFWSGISHQGKSLWGNNIPEVSLTPPSRLRVRNLSGRIKSMRS